MQISRYLRKIAEVYQGRNMRNLTLKVTFLLFFISTGFSLFAHTLSVMVVETGVNDDTPRINASSLWEGGMMDVFFDNGHIVSNAPILRVSDKLKSGFPEERLLDIAGAKQGGVDYYILAVLNYEGQVSSINNDVRPNNIAVRLVRINPYKVLFEKRYKGNPALSIVEEKESAKKAAKSMLSHF